MLYKRINTPSVWSEMERFQREFNRLFDDAYSGHNQTVPEYPAIAIWTNQQGAVVTAEVPGVEPGDISLNVINLTLTLSGSRSPERVDETTEYHRQERAYGKFTRSIDLPFPVNANAIEASLAKGILTVNLPRAEADKPRKITVKATN